ncbi:MAG TPA: NnrU family protein [Casimicrobiaceae bacterium]|nr:NnrU family protein [Casimicrobiaceae bacterium]
MKAFLSLCYGVLAYLLFLGTFLYTIGFVGNVAVPKSIDSGAAVPLGQALVVDLLLLGLFGLQHSVMARRSFKAWWTRIVSPVVERSTFVLASSLVLVLLLWQWRPIAEPVVWQVAHPLAAKLVWIVFWLGWAVLFVSSFLINHFELFGVSQVVVNLNGAEAPKAEFRTPLFYRYVRHPLYLGFMLGFWATPVMTAGHLLFALGCTGYILVGIWFEERDLVAQFGERYLRYRRQVGMLVPSRRAR